VGFFLFVNDYFSVSKSFVLPNATAVLSSQRLKLQTTYGQAMNHARGYSAPETTAALPAPAS